MLEPSRVHDLSVMMVVTLFLLDILVFSETLHIFKLKKSQGKFFENNKFCLPLDMFLQNAGVQLLFLFMV